MAERRESVRLDYSSNIAQGATADAAALGLLDQRLNALDRDFNRVGTSSTNVFRNINTSTRQLASNQRTIDQYSGRLRLLGEALAVLGPGAVPIAAVAVPAVTGLASALGFAAIAGGTAVLAFQGVGDALEAMNKARLEPTAENLQAAREAMQGLSPAARDLVRQLQSLRDEGLSLRDAAAEGFMPGASEALDNLLSRLPQVERILTEVGDAAGDILAGGAASLASPRWDEFFDFIETDARESMLDLAEATGNVTHALASLLIASDPLSDDFSGWLVTATERFDEFAQGVGQSEGFQEFIDYVRTNGPRVADAVGAIATALMDIVTAAAPLGGPVLMAITAVARAISVIADSDMGTALLTGLAAMSLLTRATAAYGRVAQTSFAQAATGASGLVAGMAAARTALARGAAAGGLLALSMTDVDDKMGVANTAMGAMAGFMVGGPWGAAIGGAIGVMADFAGRNDDAAASLDGLTDSLDQQTGALTARSRALVDQSLEQQGALEAADELGVSLEDVSAAANGNDAAFRRVREALGEVQGGLGQTRDSYLQAGAASQQYVGDAGKVIDAITMVRDRTAESRAELDRLNRTRPGGGSGSLFTDMAEGAGDLRRAALDATSGIRGLDAALADLSATLDRRASLRDYQEALDGLRRAVKDNGANFDITTGKGREVVGALDNIAGTALRVAENMRAAGKVQVFDDAIGQLRRFAREFPAARGVVRGLIDELKAARDVAKAKIEPKVDTKDATADTKRLGRDLDDLGGKRPEPVANLKDNASRPIGDVKGKLNDLNNDRATPSVDANVGGALGGIAAVNSALANIDRNITVTVNTIRNTLSFDTGGWTGNEPRNKAVGVVHGQEFVVRAGVARRYRAELEYLNSLPGYATGGEVGPRGRRVSPAQRFDLGGIGVDRTRQELQAFRRQVGHVGKAFETLSRQAIGSAKEFEQTQERMKKVRARATDIRQAAAGSFNNDIYGGGLTDLRTQLQADANDAERMRRLLRRAERRGLSGQFAAGLAQSGNLTLAAEIARSTPREVRQLERLFASRTREQGRLGNTAADVAMGPTLDKLDRTMRQQIRVSNRLEHAIERGAARGTRAGTEGRDRRRNREVANRRRVRGR